MKKVILILMTVAMIVAMAAGCEQNLEVRPDLNKILTDLDAIASQHRPIGSQGEQNAVDYLSRRFGEMGYSVSLQPYTDDQGRRGTNVIAVKEASSADADILVLSSHHDSVPTSYGANDNASGVAALLCAAEMLKGVKTDTQIRFISFTDEENGKNGSRFYTDSLTTGELERMVGCIQLDMLGGLGSVGTVVCTMDGQSNWVSDLLMKKAPDLTLGAETASDHASFQLAGVPSVLLTQKERGYLYHSAADRADQLNPDAIAGAAQAAADAAMEIAGEETASYRNKVDRNYTFHQTRQNVIHFEASRRDTEAYIGAPGKLVEQRVETGDGWSDNYDTYLYSMRWFDGEEPMNTYYRYRNDYLQDVVIRPFETGYTIDQVWGLLTAMYGQPDYNGMNAAGRPYEAWQDEIYGKYISLTDAPDGFFVTVGKYSVGITNTLASYEVVDGEAAISDPEDQKVWDLLCRLIPVQYRQKITQFQLFSDGASGILAYTSPIKEEGVTDNSRFSITVDYYDVFDENGEPRDWSKLTYTILHEYGHVLLEDETQIDLTVGANTHDPKGFIEGSFRKSFYYRFWKALGTTGVGDYEANPTHYVSRYGANLFHEDIADTFAIFLLGGKPTGDTVAEEKLLFFWQYPEMVELRSVIRQNLGLADEEAVATALN